MAPACLPAHRTNSPLCRIQRLVHKGHNFLNVLHNRTEAGLVAKCYISH